MDIAGLVVGVLGLLFGFWQWRKAERQGNMMTTFLIGLKSASLPSASISQINDMIERLK